jgi:muconate cycloisomerase
VSGELTLRSVETFIVSLPTRRPHLWVGLTAPAGRGYLVVRLELDNGVVGWGESQPIQTWGGDDGSRYGETPETTRHIVVDHLVPALKGQDLRQFEAIHASMDRAIRGHPYAKAAIEVAILDAVGRSLGVPVYQFLGGRVRDRVRVAHSIGLMETRAAIDEAERVVAEGVTTLKIKIGIDPDRDVQLVREIRRAIGDKPDIRVDANQGYRNWRDALSAVNRMAEYGIIYAEQLVNGLEGLAEVSARSNVPIMADESVWTERDVLRIARLQAAQYLSVYYTKPGGLWKAKRLLVVAGANQMFSDINGSGEMGIGNAANLHLAAAAPEVTLAGTIPVTSTAEIERTKVAGRKYLDDIIVTPFEFEDGHLLVPNLPGLGIEVDERKLAKYQVS